MLILLLLGHLRLFGYLLFLTLVLILFPTFVSHCVTPFRLYLSFRREDCSRTADSGADYLHGAEGQRPGFKRGGSLSPRRRRLQTVLDGDFGLIAASV